jgi:hypothetical protein
LTTRIEELRAATPKLPPARYAASVVAKDLLDRIHVARLIYGTILLAQLGACGALTERIVSGLDSWLLPLVTWFHLLTLTNSQCRASHFPHTNTRPPISHSKQLVCRCRATDARISAAFAGHAQGCVPRAEYATLRFPTTNIPSIRTDEWPTHAPLFLCAKIHVWGPPRTFSCPPQPLKKRNGKTLRWWPT